MCAAQEKSEILTEWFKMAVLCHVCVEREEVLMGARPEATPGRHVGDKRGRFWRAPSLAQPLVHTAEIK